MNTHTIAYKDKVYFVDLLRRSLINIDDSTDILLMPKCGREACHGHACCVNTVNGNLYCVRCSRKMNESTPGLLIMPSIIDELHDFGKRGENKSTECSATEHSIMTIGENTTPAYQTILPEFRAYNGENQS